MTRHYEIVPAERVGVGDNVIFGNDPVPVTAVDATSNVLNVVVVFDGRPPMTVERGTRFAVDLAVS